MKRTQALGCLTLLIALGAFLIPAMMRDQARRESRSEPASAQEALQFLAEDAVSGDVVNVIINDIAVVVDFEMAETLSGYSVGGTERQMQRLACALRESGDYGGVRYQFVAKINVVDGFGNEDVANGLAVRLEPETITQMNCDNVDLINLAAIADFYDLHRLLQ